MLTWLVLSMDLHMQLITIFLTLAELKSALGNQTSRNHQPAESHLHRTRNFNGTHDVALSMLGQQSRAMPHWVGEAPSEASHLLELQPKETDYRTSRQPQFLIRPSLMPGRAIRATTCRSLLRGASWGRCELWEEVQSLGTPSLQFEAVNK
jgi:hypothetical protein